jgi:hypothetical protein
LGNNIHGNLDQGIVKRVIYRLGFPHFSDS